MSSDGPGGGEQTPDFVREGRREMLPLWVAIGCGVLYGVIAQLAVRTTLPGASEALGVMSFTYVFVLPLILGAVTLACARRERRESWAARIFVPWLTCFVCMGVALLVGWEGSICVVMALPIYLPMSSLGGIIGGFVGGSSSRGTWAIALLAPLVAVHIETRVAELPTEVREVVTSIDVEASPEAIWPHITRIPAITEEQTGFFYRMGFPKPVSASLSHDGVGGVREAKFERGLVFYETVTAWEPPRRLAFDIEADPNATPLTTLDPHVVPGGVFFDALMGEYRTEPLADGTTRLWLTSRYRLSTMYNPYARLWGDYLMRDIQDNILRVIEQRCERAAAGGA